MKPRRSPRARRSRGLLVVSLLLASATAALEAQTIHDDVVPQQNGPTIHYAISVPREYKRQPTPLILALHFGGDPRGAGHAMLQILVQPALGDLGAILVAPDSVGGGWSTAPNEQAVTALLAHIEKAHVIDQKKVVVMGYSMGGSGAWYWAGKYPERFSAAIPVSGRPTPAPASWRVPVLAIHSTADEVNPIGFTAQRVQELKAQGAKAEIVTIPDVPHYETASFVPALKRAVPWIREIWK